MKPKGDVRVIQRPSRWWRLLVLLVIFISLLSSIVIVISIQYWMQIREREVEKTCQGILGADGKTAKCVSNQDCLNDGGVPTNLSYCSYFGDCCGFQWTCEREVRDSKEITFTNPSDSNLNGGNYYPLYSLLYFTYLGLQQCQLKIHGQPNVCHLRLDFEDFSFPPDKDGVCTTDGLMVKSTTMDGQQLHVLPILCGNLTGQTTFIEFGQRVDLSIIGKELIKEKRTPSCQSPVMKMQRKWKIKVTMIACNESSTMLQLPTPIIPVSYVKRGTSCHGQDGQQGICLPAPDCFQREKPSIGPCVDGRGVCCLKNSTYYTCDINDYVGRDVRDATLVNPKYSEKEVQSADCDVTIERSSNDCHLRLDFDDLSLTPPNKDGIWENVLYAKDAITGQFLPQQPGINGTGITRVQTGRSVTIPFTQHTILSVFNRRERRKRWKIKVTRIPCQDTLIDQGRIMMLERILIV